MPLKLKPTAPWLEVRYFYHKIQFLLTHKVDTEDTYLTANFAFSQHPKCLNRSACFCSTSLDVWSNEFYGSGKQKRWLTNQLMSCCRNGCHNRLIFVNFWSKTLNLRNIKMCDPKYDDVWSVTGHLILNFSRHNAPIQPKTVSICSWSFRAGLGLFFNAGGVRVYPWS